MSEALRRQLRDATGISDKDYEAAEKKAASGNITIMQAIELMNVIPEEKVLGFFANYYRMPKYKFPEKVELTKNLLESVPKEIAEKFRCVPFQRDGQNISVAIGDPRNSEVVNAIRIKTSLTAKVFLTNELKITELLEKYYSRTMTFKGVDTSQPTKGAKAQVERANISAPNTGDDGPIIKIVNQLLSECINRRASDIHIEPYETFLRVRLRVDGVLFEIARPPAEMKAALTTRVKIMANLNIAQTRLPQDGAINIRFGDKPIDFRVSCLPTVYGEKIVMRVLDKSTLQVDMTKLGFETDELEKFHTSIHSPFGMVLVTGPTGSGKTTTLYSALADLNKESDNIMTAEDPVEYNLEGINQVQVKPDIGLTFAEALRSFLRQDPDVVMVGEIRDLETAEIAMKAALTGHMVLSTLHTNSAPDTISRLLNMGAESFSLVSALTCITAQRLVRKICERCKIPDDSMTPKILIELGIPPAYADKVKIFKGQGCSVCSRSGYQGRIAVHEVLKVNDPIRDAILKGLPSTEIKKIAMATGMRSLRQSALNKMIKGITSALEVVRATSADVQSGQSGSSVNAA